MKRLMKPTGLTLIETVVTTSCLSLLLCISMPAIQHCREGSDLEICANNLRGIGVAAAIYDETEMMLPPYMGVPSPQDCNHVFDNDLKYQLTYPVAQLLAHLGYQELVDQVDPFAFSNADMTIQDVGYSNFSQWRNGVNDDLPGIAGITFDLSIAELRCPSDLADLNTVEHVLFGSHQVYVFTGGCFRYASTANNQYSITNYCASSGATGATSDFPPPYGDLSGPIQSRHALSASEIPDGASNVVFFGESLGGINNGPFDGIYGARFSLSMGGLAFGRGDWFGIGELFGDFKYSHGFQFGSGHTKSVNFLFADGSVRSLNRGTWPEMMGRLCGARDGSPVFGRAK